MEQRIKKLERQCRWYRNLFVVAGLIAVALVTWGAAKPIPKVIKARSFQVVNNENTVVAALGSNSNVGSLILLGTKGKKGKHFFLAASLKDLGGFIQVSGAYDKSSVTIYGGGGDAGGAVAKGGGISVSNKTGEEVIQLYTDASGSGVVSAYDREGRGRMLRPRQRR